MITVDTFVLNEDYGYKYQRLSVANSGING